MIKKFEEFVNESRMNALSTKQLYDWMIKNYEQLGDDAIEYHPSTDDSGCDEITIPFVIGEEPLLLEPVNGEPNAIFSIDIPVAYEEYVSSEFEIDPEGEGDDGYIRVFDTEYNWTNDHIINFLDSVLAAVPNPALRKKALTEGLISDYKKQEEAKNKEVSNSEKTFVLDTLKRFEEIELPFVFTYKNGAIISSSVDKDKVNEVVERNRIFSFKELKEDSFKDIHISSRSVLNILDKDSEWLGKDVNFKNIWESIYKWFDKRFEKEEVSFNGKIKVEELIDFKNDIKKELF